MAATLLLLMAAAVALFLTRQLTGTGFGFVEQRPILARFALFEVAMAVSALGSILLTAAVLARARTAIAGMWSGLLLTGLAGALALQVFFPTITFIITWPLIAAASVSALTGAGERRGRIGQILGLTITAIAFGWLGGFFHGILQGLDVPEAPTAFVWLAAMVMWPLAWPAPSERWRFAPGAAALAVGLVIALLMRSSKSLDGPPSISPRSRSMSSMC